MGDFHTLAFAGKQGGVLAHDVAAAHGGKADGLRAAGAGVAFAAIHGAVGQVAAERAGNHFAHAQRGAAGGVHFVAVVRFDDFDVVAFVQHAGYGVEDVEGEVYADAEVGGKYNAGAFGGGGDGGFARFVETGGTDNHVDTAFGAAGQKAT